MTKIQNLEKRVEALEPEPSGEDLYYSWLSRCTMQELRDLDNICKRLDQIPENERTLTPSEREIVETIERRLGIGREILG